MNVRDVFGIVFAVIVCGNVGSVGAYEGGTAGSLTSDPCSRVLFSEFKPQQFSDDNNNTEVAPQSEFSFLASQATIPKSIMVTIDGETVPIDVKSNHAGFQVTGNLPPHFKGTFVRIQISAQGPYQCTRGGGWLLKVAD